MEHVFLIASGVVMLAVTWMCWSAGWRGWSRIATLPLAPITALPAIGVMFVAMGAGELLRRR